MFQENLNKVVWLVENFDKKIEFFGARFPSIGSAGDRIPEGMSAP